MTHHLDLTFETPEPIELYVENGRGTVTVSAIDTVQTTTVRIKGERAEEYDVRELADGREPQRIAILAPRRQGGIFGRDPRAEIVVEVPLDSSLTAKVGSSDVATHGRLTDTQVDTGSGDITLDVVAGDTIVQSGSGDVLAEHLGGGGRIKAGSGDIRVTRADADLVVTTGSGDVRIGSAAGGEIAVKTGSGDAQVGSLDGDLVFTTGSGDLAVSRAGAGRITAKTASGDIGIGVCPGTPVWTDVSTASGRPASTLPATGEPAEGQPYLEVRATTASGDVTLHQS